MTQTTQQITLTVSDAFGAAETATWTATSGYTFNWKNNGGSATAATSASITTGGSIAQGDFLLVMIDQGGGVVTPPSGWTVCGAVNNGSNAVVFWKIAGVSEPSSYSFTWTTSGAYDWAIASWTGLIGVDVSAAASGAHAGPFTAPSITPTNSTDVLLCLWDIENSAAHTPPAGMITRLSVVGPGSTYMGISELQLSSAAATATESTTGTASASYWVTTMGTTMGGVITTVPVIHATGPVVNNANFILDLPVSGGAGEIVGVVTATNSPTSWSITNGNSSGYFAINSSGQISVTSAGVIGLGAPPNGQMINLNNTGRAGAAAAAISGYSATLTTVSGAQTYGTSQTFNNILFTGPVIVTGGNVVFNFCSFTYQPPSASTSSGAALQQYNGGAACGTVICNWCTFDTGLRGTQGNFETEAFNAGQRTGGVTNQPSSTFTLYRCSIQGFGNGVSLDGWQCAMSYITECYFANCTSGGGTHMDNIEIYGSDNITVQRCRMVGVGGAGSESVLANITNDLYNVINFNPIILQNNMVLPQGDSAPILAARNNNNQTQKTNISVIGNFWGDNTNFGFETQWGGSESPITGLNVTYNQAYFNANESTNVPGLVYWDGANVWTPNGEGVTGPAGAQGLPHNPGAFIDSTNFSNGPSAWTGSVLGPAWAGTAGQVGGGTYSLTVQATNSSGSATGTVTVAVGTVPTINSTNFVLTVPVTNGQTIGTATATNSPTSWAITGGNSSGYFAISNSGTIVVTAAGSTGITSNTYNLTLQATNSFGPGSGSVTVTAGTAPVVTSANFNITLPATNGEIVGTMSATSSPTAWSITAGNTSGYFAINNSGQVSITSAGASGIVVGTYVITVQAINQFGAGTNSASVTFVSQAPVVNSASFNLGLPATSGEAVGTVTASNNPTSWSITTGNTSGFFAIDNLGDITVTATGASSLTAGTYTLTVQATNSTGSGSATVTVSASANLPVVTPINFSIATNPANDTLIGTITATNSPTSWAIASGNSSGYFAIYAQTAGTAHLRTIQTGPIAPDGVYDLTVTATNATGTGSAAAVDVTVGAAPSVVNGNFSLGIPATNGASVGTMTTTGGTATSWSITAGNSAGYFAISSSGNITVTSTGASGIVAGSYNLTIQATNAVGSGSGTAAITASTAATGVFPGQAGNLVGFANTPAALPVFTSPTAWPGGTWPGAYPGSLTPWPGGTGGVTISNGTNATSGSGTATDPWIFAFYDFDFLTSGGSFSGNVTFVGCRFQSNQVQQQNISTFSGGNVSFFYCTIQPRVALVGTSPPNAAWPSAGAGLNLCASGSNVAPTPASTTNNYQIPNSDGYEYGIWPRGAPLIIDHCDFWGFGNAIPFSDTNGGNGASITDNWIHDAANEYDPNGYHTDGPGYLNGTTAPSNISVIHNTIAGLGNTNALAFQASTSGYNNIIINNNYLSGFGNTAAIPGNPGFNTGGGSAGCTFIGNVFGTDFPQPYNFIYDNPTSNYTSASWNNNKLKVVAGTSPWPQSAPQWTSSQNGFFVWPNNTVNSTDF